jgi:hypothetical protein
VKLRFFLPRIIAVAAALMVSRAVFPQGVQIAKPGEQPPAPAAPAASPEQPKPTPIPTPTPTAAEVLYVYLQQHHLEVAKYQAGTRFIWTDRVFIEIPDGPPPEPLAGLLALAPGNSSQFSTWVNETFESQVKTWQPGKRNPHPDKAGTEEFLANSGGTHCFVNPVYVAYVMARYPNANVLVKGPKDPVLFTVNGQLRAVISPWTQLPDGTPLM